MPTLAGYKYNNDDPLLQKAPGPLKNYPISKATIASFLDYQSKLTPKYVLMYLICTVCAQCISKMGPIVEQNDRSKMVLFRASLVEETIIILEMVRHFERIL
jgi:hypothetical protein